MACRINLREDQSISLRSFYSSDKVSIFAFSWVKEATKILGKHLNGTKFDLFDNNRGGAVESITISEDFNGQSLKLLQQIARNEEFNVTGVVNTTNYSEIKDEKVLYSLRDLVRQCVIAGRDNCIGCGGYGCRHEVQSKRPVYICDLAALQFQQPYNTGRLILIQETERHKAILDDFIYENVVGEKKRSFAEVRNDWNAEEKETRLRYLPHDGFGLPGRKSCFIDTTAYRRFVASDLILSAISICEVACEEDELLFKFLKYGTGFFAGKFQAELERLILPGVLDGLEKLYEMQEYQKSIRKIKCIELPFYKLDPQSEKRIQTFQSKYGIEILISMNDALQQFDARLSKIQHEHDSSSSTSSSACVKRQLIVATTNCGDNHAVCGNEMGFSSVDAAIAENLESKGNLFCSNINPEMKERYLTL